jgi:predicted metal-dependent peptidase
MSSPDAFAALEQAAVRQDSEEKALKAVAAARAKLVLTNDARSVFFATLVLRLNVVIDWSAETMATDGKSLFVNPDWCNALTNDERVGTLCHETLHLVMRHHCRREGRDPSRWNEATDLSANFIIEQAGFTLPRTRLMPGEGKYRDFPPERSAEEYYALLSEPPKDGEQEAQDGGARSDPGGCGEVRDVKDPAEAKNQEAEWDAAVAQAEQASKGRGELPGGIARLVGQVLHPPADWRSILREFVSSLARNDYSWSHPNRRHVAAGLYLAGMRSQELGEVVVAIDTSGSVGEAEMSVFANEVEAILGAFDCSAVVLYHDSAITNVDEWKSSDGPLKLDPVGGGGTSHVPVFEHVANMSIQPACVVALTDAYSVFPASPPECPVLWAIVGDNPTPPPFGHVVRVHS